MKKTLKEKQFTDICRLSQSETKQYMKEFLSDRNYSPVDKDGFLYAKGDIPVLLVAHMDTVHETLPKTIYFDGGIYSSPEGIGGDDRCGIFIIQEIVKLLHCSVLLCEDEEIGMIGAEKFANTELVESLDVNYIIEFDRANSSDAVFYRCDNGEFTDFVIQNTGFKKAHGTFTDISVIAPAAGIAAVNLSCGYYKAHTVSEYVVYSEMLHTIEAAKRLIQTDSKFYEYIESEYSNFGSYYDYEYYGTYIKDYGKNTNPHNDFDDFDDFDDYYVIEVTYKDSRQKKIDCEYGLTKHEAWYNFFVHHPMVSYSDIVKSVRLIY